MLQTLIFCSLDSIQFIFAILTSFSFVAFTDLYEVFCSILRGNSFFVPTGDEHGGAQHHVAVGEVIRLSSVEAEGKGEFPLDALPMPMPVGRLAHGTRKMKQNAAETPGDDQVRVFHNGLLFLIARCKPPGTGLCLLTDYYSQTSWVLAVTEY